MTNYIYINGVKTKITLDLQLNPVKSNWVKLKDRQNKIKRIKELNKRFISKDANKIKRLNEF